MENRSEQSELPSSKNPEAPTAREFAKLLPPLYYAVNRILEDSAPSFSKKVGVVLLALQNSSQKDEVGAFLTTGDIARLFRETFVATESSVKSETSKVKNDLFALNFVKIEGGKDHIHLTVRGEEAASLLLSNAAEILRDSMTVLTDDDQRALLAFAERMMAATIRKFAQSESPSRTTGQEKAG
jgi:hypothetical protein